jgi:hypothetical protein
MSSNGFDKILQEFQKDCWENLSQLSESLEWHDIIASGEPAEVKGRSTYRGYVLRETFYYMGHNHTVNQLGIAQLGDKLSTQLPKPPKDMNLVTANEAADTIAEGLISGLPTGWFDWKAKHGLTQAFGKKKLDTAVELFKLISDRDGSTRVKKPLLIAAQLLDLDPRILAAELDNRGIDHQAVKEGNLGTKQNRPGRGQPRGMKFTNVSAISNAIRQSSDFDIVKSHYINDGMVALVRDGKGDAYEVTIKPSYYGNYFDKERGIAEEYEQAQANGTRVATHEEIIAFHNSANATTIAAFNQMLENGQPTDACHLIDSTIGSKTGLADEAYSDLDKHN